MSGIGALLSFVLPVAAGWQLVRFLWPAAPRSAGWVTGALMGMGMAGTSFFLGLILFGSRTGAIATSEVFLVGAVALLLRIGHRSSSAGNAGAGGRWRAIAGGLLAVSLVLAGLAFLYATSQSSHGGWDTVAIWNMKARFIERGGAAGLESITDPWLLDTQPDYPLLLPSLVARGWWYAGQEARVVPVAVALVFLSLTIALVVTLVRIVAPGSRAMAAGAVLAGTPFLIQHAASLYADILMAAFITGATLLWSIRDAGGAAGSRGVVVLAGMAAGFAASTKNEGLLFVLVLFAVRAALMLWRAQWATGLADMARAAGGLAATSIAVATFKLVASPDSPIVAGMTGATLLGRMGNEDLHRTVAGAMWGELSAFGLWWLSPVPLLIAHAAVASFAGRSAHRSGIASGPWWTPPLVVLGMAAGLYHVYLFSPYDVAWHVMSSFSRLVLQLWPLAVVVALTLGTRSITGAPAVRLSRVGASAAAAGILVLTLLVVSRASVESPAPPPVLELSRTEVVAGVDAYTLRVRGMEGESVDVGYRFEGGDEEYMRVSLDDAGEIAFDVSADTPPGTYTFTRVRRFVAGETFPVTGSVTVR